MKVLKKASTLKSMFSGTVITTFLALVLFGSWLYVQQPSMIFFPDRDLRETPNDWGMQYEEIDFMASDGINLHGWYIPNTSTGLVLLFLHGNAGNISHRGESVSIFNRLGMNVLIIDYRGYGKSKGNPDEKGLYRDARAAWHYLTHNRKIKKENIIIFGRSLGGAVASELAAEVQPGYLFLESTFSSTRDVARKIFPVMSRIIPMRFEFNTVEYVRKVKVPLLIAHSPDDEIIPFELGEKIFTAANEPKYFYRLTGDHNGGFLKSQPGYEQAISKFLSLDVDRER